MHGALADSDTLSQVDKCVFGHTNGSNKQKTSGPSIVDTLACTSKQETADQHSGYAGEQVAQS